MSDLSVLVDTLERLDGKGYGAYKTVKGVYRAASLTLEIEHVQGDPYATPSRLRAHLAAEDAGFPDWAVRSADRRRATADFVNRALVVAFAAAPRVARRGSGKSGILEVLPPGQQVLERTSITLSEDGAVAARFRVGLPARGRRILGREAAELLGTALIRALEAALPYPALDSGALREHVEVVGDAVALRRQLPEHGLVAFVADGSRLPRRSGIDDRPLGSAVPFISPQSLRVTLDTPNRGPVQGMGVPEGMTLIVGGGYHGKSTLLRALERGVYDHIPGDGREAVVTVAEAVKVRAEDGRSVAGTDISNFIGTLPGDTSTRTFVTENASGSTSQAAAMVEALEVGARVLLLDEDTSATNFMIRDGRMQRLVADEDEPIVPFIDRVGPLAEAEGVSTVAVIGGSGDYFDVADTVIAMREYRPREVTSSAREVAEALPSRRRAEGGPWRPLRPRRPVTGSIDPARGRRAVSIKVRDRDRVEFGSERVDLGAVEQIAESAQTRAMAHAVAWARNGALNGDLPLDTAVLQLMEEIADAGLAAVHPYGIGELAAFRPFELAAFLNRLRSLRTEEV